MMTGSLSRSLSFGRGSHQGKPLSNHAKDEMNVFASDIVSKEYILDRLKDVKHDRRIVKLEIEDLLIARNHNSFLPVVKALLLTDERPWKYLRFLDTIPSNDFVWWQGMKHCLMREYESTIDEEDMEVSYTKIVSFQANISVTEGATKKSISMLLKNILQDKDVVSVSFSGALFGYCDATLPEALTDLMDAKTGHLKEGFAINVKCGWHTAGSNEELTGDRDGLLLDANPQEQDSAPRSNKDWVKVLKSCHRVLRHFGDVKPQKPTRQMEDDVMSVVSARDCMSSSAHSHHSTRSADGGRRTGARRTPRRGRSGRSSRSNEHLPIMRDSLRTRRCVTLPVKNGGALRPAPSKRGVPQTRSFHQPRPSMESLADTTQSEGGGETKESEEEAARPTARRYKSFEMQRPKAGSLASADPDPEAAAKKDNKEQDKSATESSGWWADMQQKKKSRVVDDTAAIPSISMRSTPPRRKSGKSKLRRTKRLGSSDHKGRRQTAPPDYDWSIGDYVTVMEEKRVVPSAA